MCRGRGGGVPNSGIPQVETRTLDVELESHERVEDVGRRTHRGGGEDGHCARRLRELASQCSEERREKLLGVLRMGGTEPEKVEKKEGYGERGHTCCLWPPCGPVSSNCGKICRTRRVNLKWARMLRWCRRCLLATCKPISRGRGHSSGRYIEQLVEISERGSKVSWASPTSTVEQQRNVIIREDVA